jgi:hypothetical protein
MTGNDHDDSDDSDDQRVLPFAGTTRFDAGGVPPRVMDYGSSMRWWAVERGADEEDLIGTGDLPDAGLHSRIDQLPRATTADVAWKNPVTGEWETTAKHNAVVEPSRVEELARWDDDERADREHPGDHALFNVPTDDYEIINPSQFLRPLAEVLQEEDLSDAVFGEFRLHRDGGRVSADVFFDGKHVDAPDMDDGRKPIVVGMQLDWDFFGDTALRLQGVGMDFECVNAIRNITETRIVKHAGDVESRVDWKDLFRDLMEQIDLKTDQLSQMIAEASEQSLDVGELPDGMIEEYDTVLEAFYAYSGLPDYLAEVAADNCRAEAADPFEPTWWDIHRGATYAISHNGRGEVGTGGAIEQYNRLANDMLANPAEVADQVERAYEAEHEAEDLAEEGGGVAEIQTAFESVRDRREQYEEREAEIKRLAEADA